MRTEKLYPLLHVLTYLLCLVSLQARAWVDLEEWEKPKIFGQAPSAEIAQVGYKAYLRKPKQAEVQLSKTSANLLGLYPLLDNFVAGFIVGAGSASVKDVLAENQLRSFQNTQLNLELAGQYAFNEEHSLFVASGIGTRELRADGRSTKETTALLTTYTMWSFSDEIGLGIGAAGSHNSRRSNLFPLLGGSWQPSPELRIDGWLPSHVHGRWKYTPAQSLFVRLELSGEAGYAKRFFNEDDADITLVGVQTIFGWSVGMPLGVASGFLRIDPSLGFFAGNTSVKNNTSGKTTQQKMGAVPIADVRLAVIF